MWFTKQQPERNEGNAEMEANIESLLEMVIDLNERVRVLEGVMADQGFSAKIPPEIDERGPEGLLNEAKELVLKKQRASVALLQKALRVTHTRAFRLIEALEEDGVIGPYRGKGDRVVNQSK